MCAHGNGPRGHGERSEILFSPGAAGRASMAMQDTDSGSHIAAREKKSVLDCFPAHFGPPHVHQVNKLTYVFMRR